MAAVWLFLHPLDYMELYNETLKPLAFLANHPNNKSGDYFDQVCEKKLEKNVFAKTFENNTIPESAHLRFLSSSLELVH
jgi:hypothetical protein